jgi:hypothetical protein
LKQRIVLLLLFITSIAAFAEDKPALKKDLTIFDSSDAAKAALAAIQPNGTIISATDARRLVKNTVGLSESIDVKDFYCVIHIMDWAYDADGKSAKPGASNWYIYNSGPDWDTTSLVANKRIFGIKRPYLLVIHRNISVFALKIGDNDTIIPDKVDYSLAYQVAVTPRTAANVQNFTDLVSLFPTKATVAKLKQGAALSDKVVHVAGWAYERLDNTQPPSTLSFQAAIAGDPSAVKGLNIDQVPYVVDNEGLYWWDVSVGIPITSYQQIQTLSTPAGLSQAQIDKRNAFALMNVFLWPVDIKSGSYLGHPHIVVGAAMASQPLHAIFAGGGIGPAVTNFYAGFMITTEKSPDVPGQNNRHVKLGLGINFPLRAIGAKLGLKSQIND